MSKNSKSITALFAGAAIGIGLGILFAPDKGQNTRGKLKQGFDSKAEDFKIRIASLTELIRSKTERAKSAFNESVNDFEENSPEVIAALQQKLEELKAAAASLRK
jgi:gas vesicle protein